MEAKNNDQSIILGYLSVSCMFEKSNFTDVINCGNKQWKN